MIVLSQKLYVQCLLNKFSIKNCRMMQSSMNKDFNVTQSIEDDVEGSLKDEDFIKKEY